MIRALLITAFTLIAASCAVEEAVYPTSPYAVTTPALPVNVSKTELFFEGETPTRLRIHLEEWSETEFVPRAENGRLEIIIEEASFRETNLPTSKGIEGFIYEEVDRKIETTLRVTARLYTGEIYAASEVKAETTVTRDVSEKATLDQYDATKAWLFHDAISTIDTEIKRQFLTHAGTHIPLPPQTP